MNDQSERRAEVRRDDAYQRHGRVQIEMVQNISLLLYRGKQSVIISGWLEGQPGKNAGMEAGRQAGV